MGIMGGGNENWFGSTIDFSGSRRKRKRINLSCLLVFILTKPVLNQVEAQQLLSFMILIKDVPMSVVNDTMALKYT